MPQQADWEEIIGLANHTLTTPSLIDFVEAHRDAVPDEVVLCVRELSNRNAIRNDRLIAQLEEAVIVLNSAGITPLLVKGAAVLDTHAFRKGTETHVRS
jgi:ATP-dependent protease HslVU (ClpYQ) peptidase subunit